MPSPTVSASQLSNLSPELRRQLVGIVEEKYDLGGVQEAYEISGGCINRNYRLVVLHNGIRKNLFLRKYKPTIAEEEVEFEHALINHCVARGFTVTARVIASRQGATYVKSVDRQSLFAVYEYLEGEDKYSWNNPALNDEEFVSASKMLATLHSAALGFDPGRLRRVEPPIYDLLPIIEAEFKKYAEIADSSNFHRFFLDHLENILESVSNTRISETNASQMPVCAIHCDYHPGNLKYKDNQVIGVFDFDWSKIDLRLFDVCMAVDYFCCSWEEKNDGEFYLEKAALFIKTYQDELNQTDGMQPFNKLEIKTLPSMLIAANLCIISWIVSSFHAVDDPEDDEYLAYLKHSVRLQYSIEACKNEMARITAAIYRPDKSKE